MAVHGFKQEWPDEECQGREQNADQADSDSGLFEAVQQRLESLI